MRIIKLALAAMLITLCFSTCNQQNIYTASGDAAYSLLSLTPLPLIPPDPSPSPSPTAIYMYDAGNTHDGDLGGRVGADGICATALPLPLAGKTAKAFLSVSAGDQVRDVVPPALQTLPVLDYTGVFTISPSWNDLWDGNIDLTLWGGAGLTGPGAEYWSGSLATGLVDGTTQCQGWTDNTATFFANRGNSNFTDTNWIQFGAADICSTVQFIVCVAY